jgi:hypothetical protein
MRFALLFDDDSTLMGASRLGRWLSANTIDVHYVQMLDNESGGAAVSQRQIDQTLGSENVDHRLIYQDAASELFLRNFDSVVCTKYPRAFNEKFKKAGWRFRSNRPAFVALYAGVDFEVEKGFANRPFFDVIGFNTSEHLAQWGRWREQTGHSVAQTGIVLNPYFLSRGGVNERLRTESIKGPVVFLAQSEVPSRLADRIELLRRLLKLAEQHPEIDFVLKLRHLEDENLSHKHREFFSYPWMLSRYFSDIRPKNFTLSFASMEEELVRGEVFLSCTSTGVIEALAHGKRGGFLAALPFLADDLQCAQARRLFADSGLLYSETELALLASKAPTGKFLGQWVHGQDAPMDLLAAVESFQRAQQLHGPTPILRPRQTRYQALRRKFLKLLR